MKEVLAYTNTGKFTESGVKPDYLSFPMLIFFILRITIIVTIFKSITTIIITTIVVSSVAVFVYVSVFGNLIV